MALDPTQHTEENVDMDDAGEEHTSVESEQSLNRRQLENGVLPRMF